jgi:hypothetical protein
MVIGNDEAGVGDGSHLFLASGLRQTRERMFWACQANFFLSHQLSSHEPWHASIQ